MKLYQVARVYSVAHGVLCACFLYQVFFQTCRGMGCEGGGWWEYVDCVEEGIGSRDFTICCGGTVGFLFLAAFCMQTAYLPLRLCVYTLWVRCGGPGEPL